MKQLISAEVVRRAHAAGQKEIAMGSKNDIVTPEARTVAAKLGVAFVEALSPSPNANKPTQEVEVKTLIGSPVTTDDALIASIRDRVVAALPDGGAPSELVTELVQKVLKEAQGSPVLPSPQVEKTAHYTFQKTKSGIKKVEGSTVNFGSLAAGGIGKSIGIADVLSNTDGSPMAVGYMAWTDSFFPWTLMNDEVNLILEGELHIRSEGQEVRCQPGDVVYIPRGTSVELGTLTTTRILYVTYPADPKNK